MSSLPSEISSTGCKVMILLYLESNLTNGAVQRRLSRITVRATDRCKLEIFSAADNLGRARTRRSMGCEKSQGKFLSTGDSLDGFGFSGTS